MWLRVVVGATSRGETQRLVHPVVVFDAAGARAKVVTSVDADVGVDASDDDGENDGIVCSGGGPPEGETTTVRGHVDGKV